MADVTISGLSEGLPNKNSAIIPYSDGSTTYKTSPSGIVAASPGSVLQVQYGFSNSTSESTSNAWVVCPGLSVSIILKNPNNKVLVQAIGHFGIWNSNDGYIKIQRNNTDASPLGNSGVVRSSSSTQVANSYIGHLASTFIDTPGSVGPHSYTLLGYVQTTNQTTGLYWNRTINTTGPESGSAISSITLMEIAG